MDGVVKYTMKYIQKNLQLNEQEMLENYGNEDMYNQRETDINIYLGWKMLLGNKARIYKSNRSVLNKSTCRKIYNISTDIQGNYKQILLQEASNNGTCLRYEIIKNSAERKIILDENQFCKIDENNELKFYTIAEEHIIEIDKSSIKIKDFNIEDKENKRIHSLKIDRKIYKKYYHGTIIEITKNEYNKGIEKIKNKLNEGIKTYLINKSKKNKINKIYEDIEQIYNLTTNTEDINYDIENIFDINIDNKQKSKIEKINLLKKEIEEIEKTIDNNYIRGVNVKLKLIDDEIKILNKFRDDLSTKYKNINNIDSIINNTENYINNNNDYLNQLFKMKEEIKKEKENIKSIYLMYQKTLHFVISDMGEEILYDKNWFKVIN